MIINITFKDNDFQNELEKILKKFPVCLRNFLETYNINGIKNNYKETQELETIETCNKAVQESKDNKIMISKPIVKDDNLDYEQMLVFYKRQKNALQIGRYISGSENFNDIKKKEMEEIFRKCIVAMIEEYFNVDEEYLKKSLNVRILKIYKDEWQNGEEGYLFIKDLYTTVRAPYVIQ